MSTGELALRAQDLLGRLREKPRAPEDKEQLLIAMDALRVLAASGQLHDFAAHRQSLEDEAPPLVVATFETREAADVWLMHHPHPPHQAYVLVSGEYHVVMDLPELHHRRWVSHPVLEFYLTDRVRAGLPPPAVTFRTHEEARAWLDTQPAPPRQVVIQIARENHLAVYHYRVGVRAVYALPREPGT